MTAPLTLDQLRSRLTEIDRELIELVAERQRLSREVARAKRATGHPTRDYRRERDVILGVREHAARHGVSPDVAEQILRLLIRTSLATQEREHFEEPRARLPATFFNRRFGSTAVR